MKSNFTWLMVVLLCLMVYTPAQGAIVWDHPSLLHPGETTTFVENYPVLSNGGTFGYYPGGMPSYYNSQDVEPGTVGTSTITENFNGTGQMVLTSMAQGEVVGDGFKAQAQTSITYNDTDGPDNHFNANGNAANVHQSVSATLSRKFVNDGENMMADLTAQLTGLVNFTTLAGGTFDSKASYDISATITLLEYGPGVSGASVFEIKMDEDPNSWNQVIEGVLLRSVDDYFSYQLNCGLHLETSVNNSFIGPGGFQSAELDGPFLLGDGNPMILTAGLTNVHPAPIPASLLLLLSGMGGLSVWRYFGRKAYTGIISR